MDRRRFLQTAAASAAAVNALDAIAEPARRPQPASGTAGGTISSAQAEVEGHAFICSFSRKDETWKVDSSVAGMGKLTGTFKSGEVDELKVGEKKYEKVVTVSSDDMVAGGQKISVTYYFAKDVGMVKQTLTVNGQQIVIELDKFEAGK